MANSIAVPSNSFSASQTQYAVLTRLLSQSSRSQDYSHHGNPDWFEASLNRSNRKRYKLAGRAISCALGLVPTIAHRFKLPYQDFFESAYRRAGKGDLREHNERAILNAVAMNRGVTPAQLSRLTELGPQTVSRIVSVLEQRKLITKGEPLRGHRGQPATPIAINPEGAYSIGCEIGWRHLTIVICDLRGGILGSHRRDYAFPEVRWIIPEISSLVRLMVGLLGAEDRERVRSMGISLPSGLGRNLTLLGTDADKAEQWNKVDLRAELESVTGLQVYLMNDGNSACWAELVLRPRPRPDNFAYLSIGTFIGGGVVAEGRLREGPTGNSGNLGSIFVPNATGVLEMAHLVASLYALERYLQEQGNAYPKNESEWEDVEPVLSRWLDTASKALAHVVADTAAVLEITMVIIDGELPRPILDRLVEKTGLELAKLEQHTHSPPPLAVGTIGPLAAATGAAFRPLYLQYFAGEFGANPSVRHS